MPVVVPPLIEVERTQGGHCVARLSAPVHPTPCLAAYEETIMSMPW